MKKISAVEQESSTSKQLKRRQFIRNSVGLAATITLPTVMSGNAAAAPAAPAPVPRTTGKRLLIINAHQVHHGISEGRLNRTMAALIEEEMRQKGFEVRTTHIESGYEIDQEVQNHLWADVIVTQSPVFWFGNPWIYKKYVDEVFTAGLVQQSFLGGDGRSKSDPTRQYGSGGKLMGKQYLLSLTMNSPEAAFNDPGQKLHQGRSLDEVFAANTANYKFCGADILPVFACYDVVSTPQVQQDMLRLQDYLKKTFG